LQWIEIDLLRSYEIDKIRAKVAQSPSGNTEHQVFLDGAPLFDWTGLTVNEQWLEHELATPASGQHLRIETQNSPSWVAWFEIEVIADVFPFPAATATASRSLPFDPPENAIDGDKTTKWNAGDYPAQWIEVDLGVDTLIDGIQANVAQLPDGFTQHNVSIDAIPAFSWTGGTSDGEWLYQSLPAPVIGRHVRIETTDSDSWVAWNEIIVHGNPANVPEPSALALLALGCFFLPIPMRRYKA